MGKFVQELYDIAESIAEKDAVGLIDLRLLAEHGMPMRTICKCINPEKLIVEIDKFANRL
jgi:hypothetical protein